MNRSRNVALTIVLVLLFMISACAGYTFKAQAYNSLSLAGVSYNVLWGSFADLHKAGNVTDADYQKGLVYAKQYYAAYKDAVKIMKEYEVGTKTLGEAKAAVDLAAAASQMLIQFIQPFVK